MSSRPLPSRRRRQAHSANVKAPQRVWFYLAPDDSFWIGEYTKNRRGEWIGIGNGGSLVEPKLLDRKPSATRVRRDGAWGFEADHSEGPIGDHPVSGSRIWMVDGDGQKWFGTVARQAADDADLWHVDWDDGDLDDSWSRVRFAPSKRGRVWGFAPDDEERLRRTRQPERIPAVQAALRTLDRSRYYRTVLLAVCAEAEEGYGFCAKRKDLFKIVINLYLIEMTRHFFGKRASALVIDSPALMSAALFREAGLTDLVVVNDDDRLRRWIVGTEMEDVDLRSVRSSACLKADSTAHALYYLDYTDAFWTERQAKQGVDSDAMKDIRMVFDRAKGPFLLAVTAPTRVRGVKYSDSASTRQKTVDQLTDFVLHESRGRGMRSEIDQVLRYERTGGQMVLAVFVCNVDSPKVRAAHSTWRQRCAHRCFPNKRCLSRTGCAQVETPCSRQLWLPF